MRTCQHRPQHEVLDLALDLARLAPLAGGHLECQQKLAVVAHLGRHVAAAAHHCKGARLRGGGLVEAVRQLEAAERKERVDELLAVQRPHVCVAHDHELARLDPVFWRELCCDLRQQTVAYVHSAVADDRDDPAVIGNDALLRCGSHGYLAVWRFGCDGAAGARSSARSKAQAA